MKHSQRRSRLISALRRDATLQADGQVGQLGSDFDELDRPIEDDIANTSEACAVRAAWEFYDAWLDDAQHGFPTFYYGITQDQWPELARLMADTLDRREAISHPVLRRFVPRSCER